LCFINQMSDEHSLDPVVCPQPSTFPFSPPLPQASHSARSVLHAGHSLPPPFFAPVTPFCSIFVKKASPFFECSTLFVVNSAGFHPPCFVWFGLVFSPFVPRGGISFPFFFVRGGPMDFFLFFVLGFPQRSRCLSLSFWTCLTLTCLLRYLLGQRFSGHFFFFFLSCLFLSPFLREHGPFA